MPCPYGVLYVFKTALSLLIASTARYTSESLIGKLLRDVRYVSIIEGGDDVLRDLMYTRYVVPVSKRS